MKNQIVKTITLLMMCLSIMVSFLGCASKNVQEEVVDPNFIGDFGPIQLENAFAVKSGLSGIKALEMEMYFIPRTNNVECYFRDGVNKICLILSPENRFQVEEAVIEYMNNYQNMSLSTDKPTRKNAYTTGETNISWGVMGLARNADTNLRTNHEFLEENKPYFKITIESAPDNEDDSTYSPTVELYFSPAHLEELFRILNQDTLVEMVREKEAEAFKFETETSGGYGF